MYGWRWPATSRAAADGLAKLNAALDRAARKSAGDPRPAGRVWAVTALREAANPVPVMAGFVAVSAAMTAAAAFGEPPDGPRDAVLPVLGDPVPPSGSLGLASAPGPLPTDRYLWTAAHWLAPVGCITFVRDRSPAETVRAFGGDDAAAVPGVPGLFRDRIAAIREDRGWAVVVEHHELMGLFSRHRAGPAGHGGQHLLVGPGPELAALRPTGVSWPCWIRSGPSSGTVTIPRSWTSTWPACAWGAVPGNAAACLPTLLVLAQRLTGLAWSPEALDDPHLLSYLPARPR